MPSQIAIERRLVQRLVELGKSLHLSDSVATVVAEGFVNKRQTLRDCLQSSVSNTALAGLVFLGQINEEFGRPLTLKERQYRGYEVGSVVHSLLDDPGRTGWTSRTDGVISQMHKLDL